MSLSTDTYKTVQMGTATPRDILVKAFDAACRNLRQAEDALASGEDHAEPLANARTIVSGLMTSLNFEAEEMSKNLLRLYLFALERIHVTQTEGRDGGLGEARRVLEVLGSAWKEMKADAARAATTDRGRPAGLSLTG